MHDPLELIEVGTNTRDGKQDHPILDIQSYFSVTKMNKNSQKSKSKWNNYSNYNQDSKNEYNPV